MNPFMKIGIGMSGAMGLAGAGIGATSTLATDGNVDPATGAMVGGAVGLSAIPVAGVGFKLGAKGMNSIGQSIIDNSAALSSKGIGLGNALGGAMTGTASAVGAGVGLTVAGDAASTFWGVGRRLIRWDKDATELKHVKMTGIRSGIKAGWNEGKGIGKVKNAAIGSVVNGKTLLSGAAIFEGMSGAWNKVVTSKMGTMTGVQTLTPRIPNYNQKGGMDDSGASGDLVFALHKNRRG